jgi:hypothetical protein
MNSRVMRPAVCQPLAIRPPKGPLLAASGSVWQRLWIKPIGEGDYFICLNRASAKAVHVALNINPRSTDRRSDAKTAFRMSKRRLSRAKLLALVKRF